MPDASAAEAAERKRVMEAVATMLRAAVRQYEAEGDADELLAIAKQASTELRTPVGREKNQ